MTLRLAEFITQNYSNDSLDNLREALNVPDYEIEIGNRPRRVRDLISYMRRNRRLGYLLAEVGKHTQVPFDPQSHLHLLIEDHLTSKAILELCELMALPCEALQLTPQTMVAYDHNIPWQKDKALVLERHLIEQDRVDDFVAAVPKLPKDVFTWGVPPYLEAFTAPATRPAVPQAAVATAVTYEDFILRVGNARSDGRYPVEVLRSPFGEVQPVWQEFPVEQLGFQKHDLWLSRLEAEPQRAIELGRQMRHMLFPPQIWSKFVQCVTAVTAQGKGLRLRLRIDPPQLDQWPWEYCYDEQYDFIAQNTDTPLVRSPAELTAPRAQTGQRPLRVLVIVSNPDDDNLAKLDPAPELANIQNALTGLQAQGLITIEQLPQPVTAERLLKTLRQKRHDVLHYFGHGLVLANGQGALALENEAGNLHTVDADQLRVIFRNSSVRVAFLNACNLATHAGGASMNSVARSLTRTGVAAVIAMQYKLPPSSAHLFSRTLYESLASGHPLDQALSDARSTAYVIRGDKVFWGIPVLTMRATNGKIW